MNDKNTHLDRFTGFESYQDFYSKNVLNTFLFILKTGILLTIAFLIMDFYHNGFNMVLAHIAAFRLLSALTAGVIFIIIKIPFLKEYLFRIILWAGVFSALMQIYIYIVIDQRLYIIPYIMLYYLFGTAIIIPLIRQKDSVAAGIFIIIVMLILMWSENIDLHQVITWSFFIFPTFLFISFMFTRIRDVALETYNLACRNYIYSTVDSLSRLLNRRAWYERSAALWNMAKRNSSDLSLLMIDIDHFKRVNDTYGHDCGDMVIKKVSEVFLYQTRNYDICGRLGGEEFGIILPETGIEGALEIADRIRQNVEGLNIVCNAHEISVTVSIGVVAIDESVESFDSFVTKGDEALYRSKNRGRNTVTVFNN